ncbi:MAG: phosphotransferase family protein [Roseiflexaceae bacterium]|nr:phosphotransferase family protein [Roseiflexaceae bacterium]
MMIHNSTILQNALIAALARLYNAEVQASGLQQLAGGASKEIWRLDVLIESGPQAGEHPLVLLRQLGGKIKSDALDLPEEYATLTAAYAAGVPTPRPFLFLPDLLAKPAVLVERLDGESIGRRVVRESALAAARERLPGELGIALAAIHRIDIDATGLRAALPGPAHGLTPIQTALAQIEADLDQIGEAHPAIEICLRWLHHNEPSPPSRLALVHGDFRIGNMMVTQGGLTGILDWEFAHIGDPNEDLMWPLIRDWRFGNDHLHFGGIAGHEPFFQAYANAGGTTPDPQTMRFWEILCNIRWATGCLNQADRHLSGREPNLEFASLGRRAAEMELEAIRLIRTSK